MRATRARLLAPSLVIAVATSVWGPPAAAQTSQPAQPTIDELLNLTPREKITPPTPDGKGSAPAPRNGAPSPAGVPIDPEVARRLSGEQARDVFEQAVAQMSEVSERLGKSLDAGPDTQRAQREIMAKLDQVIASAEQQQQSSSSSSSAGGQPRGQDQGSQQNAAQSEGQTGQQSKANPGAGDNGKGGGDPPDAARDGRPLEESKNEWGNLPPRLRDELLQGLNERFSPVYRELTERYYQRLAEEGK